MRQRTLGSYRIERRLATGGMAEVFVAHRLGPHGFQKKVALKCILPQHARDPDFVAMFIDEARLAALLDHPSIVQVFDFGEAEGTLFLAMELVDGTNVNRILRVVSAMGDVVPLAAALHIAIESARALAHAHHVRDDDGKPLHIVHRDVSPANLLVTRRGQIKLSDFGIARCVQSDHRTDDGHVRGKLGYMSPEQVSGYEVDARSDVFTLGTVLAEMLIGEPLFGTGTDLDVLLRIRNADLAVLDRSPRSVPQDLRAVLAKALARKPEDRIDAARFGDLLEDLSRKRGVHGRGEREIVRLLHRLELVAPRPDDVGAHEAGARPTALVETGATAIEPAPKPGAHELLSRLSIDEPQCYEIKRADGVVEGPLTYAELVRRIVGGEIDASSQIRREGGAFAPGSRVPELSRYLTTGALAWDSRELEGADLVGTIESGTLLALVHQLTARRETGVLKLDDAKRKKKIYFVEGRPEFVASTQPSELLGEYLVKHGHCLRMEVEMALALLPKYSGRLGDALVGMGVLRPVELYRAVSSQVRERYLEAFRWRHGRYAFRSGVRSHEEAYPMAQGAHELLRDAALQADPAEMEAALSGVREKVLSRESRPPAPIAAYGLPDSWTRMLRGVRGDATLGSILARETTTGGVEPEDVYRAFYLGLSCELVRAA